MYITKHQACKSTHSTIWNSIEHGIFPPHQPKLASSVQVGCDCKSMYMYPPAVVSQGLHARRPTLGNYKKNTLRGSGDENENKTKIYIWYKTRKTKIPIIQQRTREREGGGGERERESGREKRKGGKRKEKKRKEKRKEKKRRERKRKRKEESVQK